MSGVRQSEGYITFNYVPVDLKGLFRNNTPNTSSCSLCRLHVPKKNRPTGFSWLSLKSNPFHSLNCSPHSTRPNRRYQKNSLPGGPPDWSSLFRHLVNVVRKGSTLGLWNEVINLEDSGQRP